MLERLFRSQVDSVIPILSLTILLFGALPTGVSWGLDNQSCLDCHTMDMAEMSAEDRAGMVAPLAEGQSAPTVDPTLLKVDEAAFKASVHGDLDCVNCHADISDIPHAANLAPVDCAQCHEDTVKLYAGSVHALERNKGNMNAAGCVDCHGRHDIKAHTIAESRTSTKNVAKTCGHCHLGNKEIAAAIPGGDRVNPVESYSHSTHAMAIARGEEKAATCNDCHESHALYPMSDPKSSIFKMNVSKTCGKCHVREASEYNQSVHGTVLAQGVMDAPTCSDCHGEHGILAPNDPDSPVHRAAVTKSACGDCHRQERLNRRFGLSTKRVTTYQDSFHGMASRMGDSTVANCASCHGVHNILPSSDERSMINEKNLPQTCGACHTGFAASKEIGPVHGLLEQSPGAVYERWIRWFYYLVIAATLGFMALHNGMDWIRSIADKIKSRKGEKLYERLTLNERRMHVLLLVSFISLAITGFMLILNIPVPFVSGQASQHIRAWAHRISAVAFSVWFVWHVIYLVATDRGRHWFVDMIPKAQDARDMGQAFKFFLGREKHRPRFARFSYIEKLEYWALLWGALVMMSTGAVLWFESFFASKIPFWGFDLSTMIHLFEAVLATAAIIVWHFYAVIFKSDVRPMAVWWLTGSMTEEEMHEEHAGELERLHREEAAKSKK